jgi:hypothetical protein
MNNLFSAHWNGPSGKARDIDCSRPSGFGRLLLAIAIIGLAVCVLDHVSAGKAATGTLMIAYGDTGIAYGSSEQGSWK